MKNLHILGVGILFLFGLIARTESQGRTPFQEHVSSLIDEACTADNFSHFYLNIREEQNMTRRYPALSNSSAPGSLLVWNDGNDREDAAIPTYEDFWSDYLFIPRPTPVNYTWCIYVFNMERDIHGCASNGTVWGTPEFQELRLLDKIYSRDISALIGLEYPIESFSIKALDPNIYIGGNSLWHNAMVTLNINWNDFYSTVGEYLIVNVERSRLQYITDIAVQDDSFLVEGTGKGFSCDIYGTLFGVSRIGWRKGSESFEIRTRRDVEQNDTKSIFIFPKFSDIATCRQYIEINFMIGLNKMELTFLEPTRNDTGIYTCFVQSFNDIQSTFQVKSIFIYVVFVELPEDILTFNKPAQLRGLIKAPTNSTVIVRHDKIRITDRNEEESLSFCDHAPHVSISKEEIDDGNFSMFTILINICKVNSMSIGEYEYEVNYNIPTKTQPQLAKLSLVIFGTTDPSNVSYLNTIAIGICCLLVSLILAAIMIVVFVLLEKIVCRKLVLSKRRNLNLQNPSFSLSPMGDFNFQPASSTDKMEFSRSSLELHEEIGRGRFGRVIRATAYGIVPYLPNINTVAVKSTLSNTTESDEMLVTELDVMKKIEAHKNICNLLSYCTIGEPTLIIMEFACHGNLKKHLGLCQQAVVQMEPNSYINTDREKEDLVPGIISEQDIRNYAFQIASGLEHLERMGIVHCDLAARNILICEGFLLKIGDFGMSRTVTDEDNYHKIIDLDGVVAVKWAAIEALINQGYVFQSDVWSYAVVIWEIASYGAEPYADIKLGVSLTSFTQYLQDGHRLQKPEGLNVSIYQMLLSCWSLDPKSRPSTTTLKEFFGSNNSET